MTIKLDGFLRTLKKDLLLDEIDVFLKLKNESIRKLTKIADFETTYMDGSLSSIKYYLFTYSKCLNLQ